jgi:polyhydroxyalkanoate synthesis repressor PhaR
MITIKRYPNRKLYNTDTKQYITLDGIAALIRRGEEIHVTDNVTGEDLTTVTLTQIILDQEKKQEGLLSHSMLTNLIRAGGDRLTALQRDLFSPTGLWSQIDEEIRRRVQALIHQGELSDMEGKTLLDKLIRQGLRLREERRGGDEEVFISESELEQYLKQRQFPSREDIQQLYQQLEDLAARLDDMTRTS